MRQRRIRGFLVAAFNADQREGADSPIDQRKFRRWSTLRITLRLNGDPDCDIDEDALNNGINLSLFEGTCAALPATGLSLNLDPFVVRTVNHQSYGTLFQSFGPETVSARMVAIPSMVCGEWTLNLEVAGLDTGALDLGGSNPFALVLTDEEGDGAGCFDINNAIVGNQIVVPKHTVRRGVRRR